MPKAHDFRFQFVKMDTEYINLILQTNSRLPYLLLAVAFQIPRESEKLLRHFIQLSVLISRRKKIASVQLAWQTAIGAVSCLQTLVKAHQSCEFLIRGIP